MTPPPSHYFFCQSGPGLTENWKTRTGPHPFFKPRLSFQTFLFSLFFAPRFLVSFFACFFARIWPNLFAQTSFACVFLVLSLSPRYLFKHFRFLFFSALAFWSRFLRALFGEPFRQTFSRARFLRPLFCAPFKRCRWMVPFWDIFVPRHGKGCFLPQSVQNPSYEEWLPHPLWNTFFEVRLSG